MSNLTKLTLANTMMIGVIMTICSNNWISMWMGLEILVMSSIPMFSNNKMKSSESMMKYFIVQSVSSSVFMCSMIFMLIGVNMNNEMLMTISMTMKLGVSPFHNWLLMIVESLSFPMMFILYTIIKIPPLSILMHIKSKFLTMSIILSMIISSISCINQSSIRKTLAYSSIYNTSMMMSTVEMFSLMMTFFIIYSMTLMMVTVTLSIMKMNFINQIIFKEYSMQMKINFWVNMISMGGFPLLLGFTAKIMIMQMMVMKTQFTIVSILIVTSILMMMFYTRMAFTSMIMFHLMNKWTLTLSTPSKYIMVLNLTLIPVTMSLISLF